VVVSQWGNFGAVIDQGNLVTAFSNSALYSFASTILAVLLAALGAPENLKPTMEALHASANFWDLALLKGAHTLGMLQQMGVLPRT
jgi:hypothetical protein